MDTQLSSSAKIVIKGYGHTTAKLVAFFICEKKVDPRQITIFEDKNQIGGCWVEANTHSETFSPVVGLKEQFFPTYDRIQGVLSGDPVNREAAIANLTNIWKELKFNLVLSAKIIEEDKSRKIIKVQKENGAVEEHSYDWLISPNYRTMNSHSRSLSLYDGIRKVDLSKYDCFKMVGNSMNTSETMRYIVSTINPKQNFKFQIYYRNPHAIMPRAMMMIQRPGLPQMYLSPRTGGRFAPKFFKLITNKSMIEYVKHFFSEVPKRPFAGLKSLSGDFLFHPAVSSRLEFIKYSGNIEEIQVGERELLIDTRNELKSAEPISNPGNHLRFDLNHILHPLAGTYVTRWGQAMYSGLGRAVWSVMAGTKPDDKYFRITEKNISNGELGACFWNYSHDVQAKVVPFSYLLFPIDSKLKLKTWLACFYFLRFTGLLTFFINIKAIENEIFIDDSEHAFFKLKKEWEEIDQWYGTGAPYPITYDEFIRVKDSIKCSVYDLKRNLKFYKGMRYAYYALFGILLAYGLMRFV